MLFSIVDIILLLKLLAITGNSDGSLAGSHGDSPFEDLEEEMRYSITVIWDFCPEVHQRTFF